MDTNQYQSQYNDIINTLLNSKPQQPAFNPLTLALLSFGGSQAWQPSAMPQTNRMGMALNDAVKTFASNKALEDELKNKWDVQKANLLGDLLKNEAERMKGIREEQKWQMEEDRKMRESETKKSQIESALDYKLGKAPTSPLINNVEPFNNYDFNLRNALGGMGDIEKILDYGKTSTKEYAPELVKFQHPKTGEIIDVDKNRPPDVASARARGFTEFNPLKETKPEDKPIGVKKAQWYMNTFPDVFKGLDINSVASLPYGEVKDMINTLSTKYTEGTNPLTGERIETTTSIRKGSGGNKQTPLSPDTTNTSDWLRQKGLIR